jgi:hypothetical protein
LKKRAEQVLLGSEGVGEDDGGRWRGEHRGEMAQTMYAHMNK